MGRAVSTPTNDSLERLTERISVRLWRGARRADVARHFVGAGWSDEIANLVVDEVERDARPVFRRRSLRLVASGSVLAGLGLLAIGGTRLLTGTVPSAGPSAIIWLTVLGGGLRVAAGLVAGHRYGAWRLPIRQAWVKLAPKRGVVRLDADRSLLGVKAGCTREELRTAYRAGVKRWHPDQFQQADHRRAEAEARLKALNLAYVRLTQESEL